MRPNKLRAGTGCEFTCKTKYVYPKRKIQRIFPNLNKRDDKLVGCFLVKEGIAKASGGDMKPVYFFTHPDLGDDQFYLVKRFAVVSKEGPEAGFFSNVERVHNESENNDEEVQVPAATNDVQEDIARFLRNGFMVDDDNMPAPENVPNNETADDVHYGEWDSVTHCNRSRIVGRGESEPKLIDGPKGSKLFDWFLYFLPFDYIKEILIPCTNELIQGPQISEGEFVKYIGIWLLLSTVNAGGKRKQFWSPEPPNPFEGAPFRFNAYMSHTRFELITKALKYTARPTPSYRDPIHEVRDLITSFNVLMEKKFVSGWVVCLDESMSPWTRQWSCPAFVFCPRKPHPKGNEYHTIADGKSGIPFGMELVEGKDEPPEREAVKAFKKYGKTAGLLLRMCEPLFGSLKVVILDSGFCVLKGIIELKKRCFCLSCY